MPASLPANLCYNPAMVADLHLHTTYSDGNLTPAELVRHMKAAGFSIMAVTDHDIVDGVAEAFAEGKKLGIEVIAGVEFSTEWQKNEIHILGYFVDYRAAWFIDWLRERQEGRKRRIQNIIDKLTGHGLTITAEKVLAISGCGSAGRPHVAQALVESGQVATTKEAFDKYLRHGAPAYVPHFRLTPQEAIEIIHRAGGLASLAHPGVTRSDQYIAQFASEGLDALEVYYSGHDEAQVKYYRQAAGKYGLLLTGGSDFHGMGAMKKVAIGDVRLPDELVGKMREALKNML